MFFHDQVSIGDVRMTGDGYLAAVARVARSGIQEYLGSEVGRPDMPVVRVYRPPEQVFDGATMKSFAHRPMTMEHPSEMVDASNWKKHSVGYTGGEVVRDGDHVVVPLILADQAAITAYNDKGVRELSMGYTADLVFSPGKTASGEMYDAVQTNIRNNHLALVRRARGGEALHIGDTDQPQGTADMPEQTRTIILDGLPVVTTDAGAAAIEKLQNDALKAASDFDARLAVKDAAIDTLKAENDALKARVLDQSAIDARVRDRAELLDRARRVFDTDYTGKTDQEVRSIAVAGKFGDAAVEGKSPAYIEARFDMADEATTNPDPAVSAIAGAMRDGVAGAKATFADNGYEQSVRDLEAGPTATTK